MPCLARHGRPIAPGRRPASPQAGAWPWLGASQPLPCRPSCPSIRVLSPCATATPQRPPVSTATHLVSSPCSGRLPCIDPGAAWTASRGHPGGNLHAIHDAVLVSPPRGLERPAHRPGQPAGQPSTAPGAIEEDADGCRGIPCRRRGDPRAAKNGPGGPLAPTPRGYLLPLGSRSDPQLKSKNFPAKVRKICPNEQRPDRDLGSGSDRGAVLACDASIGWAAASRVSTAAPPKPVPGRINSAYYGIIP